MAILSQSSQGTPIDQDNGINSLEKSHTNVMSSKPTMVPNQVTVALRNSIKATNATILDIMPQTMGTALLAPFEAASRIEVSSLLEKKKKKSNENY